MNNLVENELKTLDFWSTDDSFHKSLNKSKNGVKYSFTDGPPFANGLPHYGHLLTGWVKDTTARYKTMRGYNVERVFGWDTHGLPAELDAMNKLNLTTTDEVKKFGLNTFTKTCKSQVMKYSGEWASTVDRTGRWVDFEGGYKTMDLNFMESTVWAFKELYNRGLVYEDYKVLPYCPRDETPLSNHELNMDNDGYKNVTHQSFTVTYTLNSKNKLLDNSHVLVWTSTPWTLPSNELLAVDEKSKYLLLQQNDSHKKYLVGANFLKNYPELSSYSTLMGEFTGGDLVNSAYTPLFNCYSKVKDDYEKLFTVQAADWVTDFGDGSGVVHVAPAYGEVDKELCDKLKLPTLLNTDSAGQYTNDFKELVGVSVFNDTVNEKLKEMLEENFYGESSYEHSYPHCWRCKSPLMFRAVSSWFVKVSALKNELLEACESVNWQPDYTKKQMCNWLSGGKDWGVSRSRFFGTPVMVWRSNDPSHPRTDVYGSLEELEKDFGKLPLNEEGVVDLHRPYVDELTRANPDDPTGKSLMVRVPDVLDVWFDSGCVPFAQKHYPFENKNNFSEYFPANFVVEYSGQVRGWFYTSLVLGVALFGEVPYKNCLSHGVLLGRDGKKLSKSLKNYPDVNEALNTYGSDSMRLALFDSSVLKGGSVEVGVEAFSKPFKQLFNGLNNGLNWLKLYGDGENGGLNMTYEELLSAQLTMLDKHLLHSYKVFLKEYTHHMDSFSYGEAYGAMVNFVEFLNNWWLRENRARVKNHEVTPLKLYHYLLRELSKLLAPLAPFYSEHLWSGLNNRGSVHCKSFPSHQKLLFFDEEWQQVEVARSVVSKGYSLRKLHNKNLQEPLLSLELHLNDSVELKEELLPLLRETLNVKSVMVNSTEDSGVDGYKVKLNYRKVGPAYPKLVKYFTNALDSGEFSYYPEATLLEFDNGVKLTEEYFTVESLVGEGVFTYGELKFDWSDAPELYRDREYRRLLRWLKNERKSHGLDVNRKYKVKLTLSKELDDLFTKDYRERLSVDSYLDFTFEEGDELSFKLL